MKIKGLLLLALLMLALPMVSAITYLPLDANLIDHIGSNNFGTAPGGGYVVGKVNYSADYTSGSSTLNPYPSVNGIKLIDLWFNTDAAGTRQGIVGFGDGVGNDLTSCELQVTTAKISCVSFDTSVEQFSLTTATGVDSGVWYQMVIWLDGTGAYMYINDNLNVSDLAVGTTFIDAAADDVYIGARWNGGDGFNGKIDNVYLGDQVGNVTWVDYSWNNGNGRDFIEPPPPPLPTNLTLTAINKYNSSTINNFSAIIQGFNGQWQQSTLNGTILIVNLTGGLHNLTLFSNTANGGYFNQTYLNINASGISFQSNLTPLYYVANIDYSGNLSNNGYSYVRNLTYSINLTCPSYNTNYLDIYINTTLYTSNNISCTNNSQIVTGNYVSSTEGNYSIYFKLNASYFPTQNNIVFGNTSFISDLQAPTIDYLNISIGDGFSQPRTNVTLRCGDTIAPNLTYDLRLNSNILQIANHSTYFNATNQTQLTNGVNTATGNCSDLFSSTWQNYSRTTYIGYISLIDEKDNTLFNLANVTGARVYFDSNSSYYDFKTTNTNTLNFTTADENQLRFELVYNDGSVITRYVDLTLINGEIRVCANKQGVTHYQQLLISAVERAAILKNLFSNCVIAADYTRFAYQDALTLQAFSIASLYYLYTFTDSEQTYLASMDGSISTYINIDQLEFGQTGYNLNILGDALTFAKVNGMVMIYYNNLAEDNTDLTTSITRMDTGDMVFNLSTFADYNTFTINFDYSTLSGINESVLFRFDLTKTNAQGTSTISRYFNTNASSGGINPFVAAVFSILLTIFGLTLASARITFSWFGIMIELGAIAILSFAVNSWYITMLLGLNAIMLIFIVLILTAKNYPTLQ